MSRKRVYIVTGHVPYKVEVIAESDDDAFERANLMPLSEWDEDGDMDICAAVCISNYPDQYFGPDRNDE